MTMKMTQQPWWRPALWVIAAVALAAAVTIVSRSVTDSPGTVVDEAVFACTACGHHFDRANARGPVTCPECGQSTAWQAMQCRKCGRIVGIDRKRMRREGIGDATCSACGSTNLRSIKPGE